MGGGGIKPPLRFATRWQETYQRRDCGDTNHSLSRGAAEGRVTDGGLDRQANFLLRIHQEATNSGGFVGPPSHLLLLLPPPRSRPAGAPGRARPPQITHFSYNHLPLPFLRTARRECRPSACHCVLILGPLFAVTNVQWAESLSH